MASIIHPDNGLLYIKGNLNVKNSLTVGEGLIVGDDVTVQGNLTVEGNTTLTGSTTASDATFSGPLTITDVSDVDLLDPSTQAGALKVSGGGHFGANLFVGGTLIASGDVVTLGNADGSVALNANVSTDIIPSSTESLDLGSSTSNWRKVYTEGLVIDSDPHTITAQETTISSFSGLCYFDENSNPSVSLDDQEAGTVKTFVLISTPTIAIQVTPINAVGFTSFTLTNAGDSISLVSTSQGWAVTSVFRTVIS